MKIENSVGEEVMQWAEKYWLLDKLCKGEIKQGEGESFSWDIFRKAIIHNMPNTFDLSFDCALGNWLARTEKYTDTSLCNYILSKNTGCIAMTEIQNKNKIKHGR